MIQYGDFLKNAALSGLSKAAQPINQFFANAARRSTGIIVQPLSSGPTITQTNGNTSSLTNPQRITAFNAVWRRISAPVAPFSDPQYQVVAGSGGSAQNIKYQLGSDSASPEFLVNRFNATFEIRAGLVGQQMQPIQAAAFTTDAAGSGLVIKVTWPDSQPRNYELYGTNLVFGGGWVGQFDSFWYPAEEDNRPLLVFAPGDSYIQGTGAISPRRTVGGYAADALGYEFWSDGIGGSGWNTASPNSPVERVARTIAVLNKVPSVIVVPLGYNDAAGNMTTAAASMDATFAALKAAAPGAQILVLGPWTPQGSTAGLTNVKNTLIARASAAGLPFVDIENIINAVNKTNYTGGDNVHPTNLGHAFLGSRVGGVIRKAGI